MMQLIEGGITGDNWNQIRNAIDSSYGSEDEKIEALRSMTGLNYTGAARLWGLGNTTSDTALKNVLTAPENKNDQTRYQEAVNDIKDAVVRIGSKAADLKIEGMEVVSKGVSALANHFVPTGDGVNAVVSDNPTEEEKWEKNVDDDVLHGYSAANSWIVNPISAKNTDAINAYLGNGEYGSYIKGLAGEDADDFMKAILFSKNKNINVYLSNISSTLKRFFDTK